MLREISVLDDPTKRAAAPLKAPGVTQLDMRSSIAWTSLWACWCEIPSRSPIALTRTSVLGLVPNGVFHNSCRGRVRGAWD
jgi:hypothetical protein